MKGKQLRAIRQAMALTQAQMGEQIRLTGNSIARMERDEVAITPSMELLIHYVVQEAGVDIAFHTRTGGRNVPPKKAGGASVGHSAGKGRGRAR